MPDVTTYRYPLFLRGALCLGAVCFPALAGFAWLSDDPDLTGGLRWAALGVFGGFGALSVWLAVQVVSRFELDDTSLTEVWLGSQRRIELRDLERLEHRVGGGKMIVHTGFEQITVHVQLEDFESLYERLEAHLPPDEALRERELPGDVPGSRLLFGLALGGALLGLSGALLLAGEPDLGPVVICGLLATISGVALWWIPTRYRFGPDELVVERLAGAQRYPMGELVAIEEDYTTHNGQRLNFVTLSFDDGRQLQLGENSLNTPYRPLIAALAGVLERNREAP